MLLPATRDCCIYPAMRWIHTLTVSADVYTSIVEFMLNMHILIALSEIISWCIFLSLSSIHELSKQRSAAGGALLIIISSAVQLYKLRARGR